MSSAVYDTLILSDLHLGSEISRAEQATRMLRENRFRRLILLGDIFPTSILAASPSPLEVSRLHPQTLQPKRGIEVVWVEGNHDRGLSQSCPSGGSESLRRIRVGIRGSPSLAIHGHQFDRFVVNNLLLSSVGTFLHLQLQKLDFKGKAFSRFLDRLEPAGCGFPRRWLRAPSYMPAATGGPRFLRSHS